LLRIKGELLLHPGEHRSVAVAEQSFGQALEMAHGQSALFWELRTAMSLARLRAGQDRPDDAYQALAATYGKFTEGFEAADLKSASAMMARLSGR
jgi:predicted ATPase